MISGERLLERKAKRKQSEPQVGNKDKGIETPTALGDVRRARGNNGIVRAERSCKEKRRNLINPDTTTCADDTAILNPILP